MNRSQVLQISTVAAIREAAPQWDDLWHRSEAAIPTLRAELVAQWLEHFAPRSRVCVLAVHDEGKWLAVLPLVWNLRWRLPVGGMTTNEWSSSGDLLVDPRAEAAVFDALADALGHAALPLVCLDGVPIDAPRWQAMCEALRRRRVATEIRQQLPIGLIQLQPNWERFEQSLAKKDRQKVARCGRRLEEKGSVELEWLTNLAPSEVEPYFRTAMEIEHRGWKGEAGTSVLGTPGRYEFFLRQARQLAAWGQLELALLRCGGRPVSFVYGYGAKGISYWHKIGYLPDEACCSPGQLLQWELLRRLHDLPGRTAVDTLGPLTRALAMWNPTPYRTGRLLVAGGVAGRPILAAVNRASALRNGCRDRMSLRKRDSSPESEIREIPVNRKQSRRLPHFRLGDLVEVRSKDEILATLDARGSLDGLPFMPEMARYCGGRFRVFRRVEKVFLDHAYEVRRMKDAVLLESLRCEGTSGNGCQMGCMLIWKEGWLKPVTESGAVGPARPQQAAGSVASAPRPATTMARQQNAACSITDAGVSQLPILQPRRVSCQATELVHATTPLPWWDVRQYVRDWTSGQIPLDQVLQMLWILVRSKVRRLCGRPPQATVRGTLSKTPAERLNLQPGDLVEVKSKEEIQATLDEEGKNRGLGFGGDMVNYCGRRYRVAKRVEKLVVEWTGEMRPVRDTVALEGVTCMALELRGCPRNCYHLWREIWLRKVEEPVDDGRHRTLPEVQSASGSPQALPLLNLTAMMESPLDNATREPSGSLLMFTRPRPDGRV